MARRHHHSVGMLDALAAHSGLRGVSPGLKTAFSVLVLLLCVGAADAVVGVAVAASMAALMWLLGRVSPGQIFRLLRIPMLFLVVSCTVILLETGHSAFGIWQMNVGKLWFCVTRESLHRAVTLFFQAMGAVSCLYFLSSSTPMPQLIEVLRRCHVSELVIELMYLIYRYLFVLLDMQQKLTAAASARLGYAGTRRSVSAAGRVCGALLASSFRRSSLCYDAMEARGYNGRIAFLSRMPQLRWKHLLWASAYVLALLALILVRKGWIFP